MEISQDPPTQRKDTQKPVSPEPQYEEIDFEAQLCSALHACILFQNFLRHDSWTQFRGTRCLSRPPLLYTVDRTFSIHSKIIQKQTYNQNFMTL